MHSGKGSEAGCGGLPFPLLAWRCPPAPSCLTEQGREEQHPQRMEVSFTLPGCSHSALLSGGVWRCLTPIGIAPSLQAPAAHRTWSFPSEKPWRDWVPSLQTSVSFSPRGANPLCRNSATRGLKSLGWGFKECTEQIGQLRSKVCEETPCGRVIRKLYCVLGLQLSMLTHLSEPLKKKPLPLSRNKGYTETACIFGPAINVCFVRFKALEC